MVVAAPEGAAAITNSRVKDLEQTEETSMTRKETIPARTPEIPLARRPAFMQYGAAVVSVGLMALLQLAVNSWLDVHTRFIFFLPAVMIASWYGGLSAALLGITMGTVIAAYFFVTVPHGAAQSAYSDIHGLLIFVMAGLMIAVLNEMQRRATRRAELARLALQERQAEIEALNTRLQRAMTETYHRVKNNLQLVAALVDVTSDNHREAVPVERLRDINQHVRALAAINDLLTQESRSREEMHVLFSRMVLERLLVLLDTTTGERRIRWNVADVALTIKQGTSLALLVNELISNAVKHGHGEVELSLEADGRQARLEVCDSGPGFPPDFDSSRAANTGLDLIESLSRWDLGGEVAYLNRPRGGARVVVTFSLANFSTTPWRAGFADGSKTAPR